MLNRTAGHPFLFTRDDWPALEISKPHIRRFDKAALLLDALDFFGVSLLKDIMPEITPTEEGGKGGGDFFIDKFAQL